MAANQSHYTESSSLPGNVHISLEPPHQRLVLVSGGEACRGLCGITSVFEGIGEFWRSLGVGLHIGDGINVLSRKVSRLEDSDDHAPQLSLPQSDLDGGQGQCSLSLSTRSNVEFNLKQGLTILH